MRSFMTVLMAILLGAAAYFGITHVRASYAAAPKMADAMVYVRMNDNEHGSGVHIGGGYVVTAAHVADEVSELPKLLAGKVAPKPALKVIDTLSKEHRVEVLWVNHTYDIALLKIDNPGTVASRRISCSSLNVGQRLSFDGNPLNLRNITMWGKVASTAPTEIDPWKSVAVISGQLVPGMSGGPAYNSSGDVAGINVGIATGYALSFIVPSSTVCRLLAR